MHQVDELEPSSVACLRGLAAAAEQLADAPYGFVGVVESAGLNRVVRLYTPGLEVINGATMLTPRSVPLADTGERGSVLDYAVATGKALRIDDVRGQLPDPAYRFDTSVDLDTYVRGLQALMVVPVLDGDQEVCGVAYLRRPDPFTESDEALIDEIMPALIAAIAHAPVAVACPRCARLVDPGLGLLGFLKATGEWAYGHKECFTSKRRGGDEFSLWYEMRAIQERPMAYALRLSTSYATKDLLTPRAVTSLYQAIRAISGQQTLLVRDDLDLPIDPYSVVGPPVNP